MTRGYKCHFLKILLLIRWLFDLQTSVGRKLDLSPRSDDYRRPSSSPPGRRKCRALSRTPSDHTPPRSPPWHGRRRRRRRSFSRSPPLRARSPSTEEGEVRDATPPPKKKKEELDPILTRTGTSSWGSSFVIVR